jgi:hypothetical protein
MHPYAPMDTTSPGTSPENPFVLESIRQCYLLLKTLRIRLPDLKGGELVTQLEVSFKREGMVGARHLARPVDHYILYIGDADKGKLMDFYMYGYGNHCMTQYDLPERLFTLQWDEILAPEQPHPDSIAGQFNRLPSHEQLPVRLKAAWSIKFVALKLYLPLIPAFVLGVLALVLESWLLGAAAFCALCYAPNNN